MLIHKHDAALDDAEWHDFLATHDFGELIVPGAPNKLIGVQLSTGAVLVPQCAPVASMNPVARPGPVFCVLRNPLLVNEPAVRP